ncbi:MAG TPA: LytTR family DNA-binding domain-containing protein [Bryobacteraceae bacterium]|nr:LytTR family DNA-binding domain-containing protein [Bryobacteraceae bacterium]
MSTIRAFVLDDEPLAVERLARLLRKTGRVEIAGTATDPQDAVEWLRREQSDVLFLDIEMPGMNGFAVLEALDAEPYVVFTTAYDRYALQAFAVHSIDYLLKPVEASGLHRALDKLVRIRSGAEPAPNLRQALSAARAFPARLPSRVGDRVEFVDLAGVSHFFAEDKLTFAASGSGKPYVIDSTITELETRLDPERWLRVHRSTLVQLEFIQEVHGFFGGRLVIRLKDPKRTELQVARDRVAALKTKLGL